MKRDRRHLTLIRGGLSYESTAKLALYPERNRTVRAQPKPTPPKYTPPPRPAA